MFILITKGAKPRIKGDLRNTLLEIQPNIFLGAGSTRIRQFVWKSAIDNIGNAAIVYPDGKYYKIETCGAFADKIVKIGATYFIKFIRNQLGAAEL